MDHDTSVDTQLIPSQKNQNAVLKNVKIYVSRKLIKQQTELYQIANSLGAEFIFKYDNSCTHFIYTGKLTDTNKELKVAREEKKIIVSPNWIYACREQGQYVDENLYTFQNNNQSAKQSINNRNSVVKSTTVDIESTEIDENLEKQMDTEELKTSETIDLVAKQPIDILPSVHQTKVTEPIPDSMDFKIMFIDQLQDKLASIKNNPTNKTSKWSKNNSSNNLLSFNNNTESVDLETTGDKSVDQTKANQSEINKFIDNDSESQLLANLNFNYVGMNGKANNYNNTDETVLSEEQALNELNKSRSKWGSINSGSTNESNMDKRKKSDIADSDMYAENSNINGMDNERIFKRKASYNSNEKNNMEMLKNCDDSPSLISKTKKLTNNMSPPASSQIQMTIWKEDQTNITNKASTVSSKVNTSNSRKNIKNMNESTIKKDAIAERIIYASRASSANSKK